MKYLVTHILSNEERQQYESQGLYCYDLRDSDDGKDIASIEKKVIVNRVGSMITNEEIKLGNEPSNNFVDYNTFVESNESVGVVEDLLVKNKELKIRLVGVDNWDRPVYKDDKGTLYKDVNLGTGDLKDSLHTVCDNDFYGEPDYPISKNIDIKLIKKEKDKEAR